MNDEEKVTINQNTNTEGLDNKDYSVDMIDTMFADSLSRGMQNAIISQKNAQMASSASITNASARILQARSELTKKADSTSALESGNNN